MTPEEQNRTIEFIIASQARLAAAQEEDRLDRIEFEKSSKATENRFERLITRIAQLQDQQAQLLVHQSDRMDRLEKFQEDWLNRNEELHRQGQDLQKQALRFLNMLLDRLPPAPGAIGA